MRFLDAVNFTHTAWQKVGGFVKNDDHEPGNQILLKQWLEKSTNSDLEYH